MVDTKTDKDSSTSEAEKHSSNLMDSGLKAFTFYHSMWFDFSDLTLTILFDILNEISGKSMRPRKAAKLSIDLADKENCSEKQR